MLNEKYWEMTNEEAAVREMYEPKEIGQCREAPPKVEGEVFAAEDIVHTKSVCSKKTTGEDTALKDFIEKAGPDRLVPRLKAMRELYVHRIESMVGVDGRHSIEAAMRITHLIQLVQEELERERPSGYRICPNCGQKIVV